MSNADIRGRFVWHELLTTDTKAAAAFYPKVTSWKTQPWDKDPSYTLWVGGKGPFGGARTLPDTEHASGPAWLAYIPGIGRMAVLADPQGAAFAIFSPGASPQSGGGSMPQEFSWHELTTTDAVGALKFYSELFGWQEVAKHDMGPMGVYHLVGINGVQSIGMFKVTPDRPMPTAWMCYAHVADVDKSAHAAKAAGGKINNGPMEVPGGTWIAHLSDPQGAAFALHADKRVAASAPPAAQPAKAPAPAAQPAKVSAPKSASMPAAKSQPPILKPAAPTAVPTPAPARPAAAPQASSAAKAPAVVKKPAAKKAAAKKPAMKRAPAKKAAAKKRAKKKPAANKRPLRKAKRAVKKVARKAAKRKSAKKRGKSARRRSAPGSFTVARRFAAKQADSLLKRLRGRKHR
jgi:predicted enzyme related to lactoylglutathione lyase